MLSFIESEPPESEHSWAQSEKTPGKVQKAIDLLEADVVGICKEFFVMDYKTPQAKYQAKLNDKITAVVNLKPKILQVQAEVRRTQRMQATGNSTDMIA